MTDWKRPARVIARSATLAGVAVLGLAAPAHAGLATPLLETTTVDRVHEVQPLGARGDRIAFLATGSESSLLQDRIMVADRDARDMRRIDDSTQPSNYEDLVATLDWRWVFWTGIPFTSHWVASTETAERRKLRLPRSGYGEVAIHDVTSGPSRFYVRLSYGSALRVLTPQTGRFAHPRLVGGGRRAKVVAERYERSSGGDALGSCAVVRVGKGKRGLRLGRLDRAKGVVRTAIVARGGSPTNYQPGHGSTAPACGVSADGSTVATIRRTESGVHHLTAVRRGRIVRVRVPASATLVGSLSPSGRYALVSDGGEIGGGAQSVPAEELMLGSRMAVVDLDRRSVRRASGLARHVDRAPQRYNRFVSAGSVVWSASGRRLALAPQAGGLATVSSATGEVSFRRSPAPPPGYAFSSDIVKPIEFADGESSIVFSLYDEARELTTHHPYAAAADGTGQARYLLSSMRSFERVVRSRVGASAWLLPSTTCRTVYGYPLMRVVPSELWRTPFETPEVDF